MIDEQVITGVVRGTIIAMGPTVIAILTFVVRTYLNSKKNNKDIVQIKLDHADEIKKLKAEFEKKLEDSDKKLEKAEAEHTKKIDQVVSENVRLADTSREYRLSFENVHRTNVEMYKRIGTLEVKAVGYDKCQEKLVEFEEENTLLRARVNSLEKLGGDL